MYKAVARIAKTSPSQNDHAVFLNVLISIKIAPIRYKVAEAISKICVLDNFIIMIYHMYDHAVN